MYIIVLLKIYIIFGDHSIIIIITIVMIIIIIIVMVLIIIYIHNIHAYTVIIEHAHT